MVAGSIVVSPMSTGYSNDCIAFLKVQFHLPPSFFTIMYMMKALAYPVSLKLKKSEVRTSEIYAMIRVYQEFIIYSRAQKFVPTSYHTMIGSGSELLCITVHYESISILC